MEPQLPRPQLPDIMHPVKAGVEHTPEKNEVYDPKVEAQVAPPIEVATPPVQTVPATATVTPSIVPDPSMAQANTSQGTPATAADDDVIEREWVDKAKQIVNNTNDDPRMQKHNISLLQADYIVKRYGKSIKTPNKD